MQFVSSQSAMGIISACAERTCCCVCLVCVLWDYLRVCGADPEGASYMRAQSGLSPRVRSGPVDQVLDGGPEGIISACAERTIISRHARDQRRDYLRVCGADGVTGMDGRMLEGLSPRVRSGRRTSAALASSAGIISACAERTSAIRRGLRAAGVFISSCAERTA